MAAKRQDVVGVIGLGIMGGAYATHLVGAGWRVIGFDIDAGRRKRAAKDGVEIARDAQEVARDAPVIILSLPSPSAW